ncbi:MAG TPA: Uma2 family endonuclease [Gemmataceae bacterium]|jgi:Uma2 family endonuclease|nr:Uma2 family endonuclease [Gemmataceae bacterium]
MATGTAERRTISSAVETMADLVRELGGIPLERIRIRPAPGTATEADVVAALEAPRKRLCELVDGVLVEKPVGTHEALVAGVIVHFLWSFVEAHDLGIVVGADGPFRLRLGLVRLPDVCFVSWGRLPGEALPDDAVARVVPDLAVEVLSKSNTRAEMERKLREYFRAGVRLVWVVDPKTQTARIYTSPSKSRRIGKEQALDGGPVLPGFSLPLKQLFARARRRPRRG